MRTSRISKDTVRMFERASMSPSAPRRTTRSLARFAYAAKDEPTVKDEVRDMEDAIPDLPPRKRRKQESNTASNSSIKSETRVKSEAGQEENSPRPRKQRKPARKSTNPSTGEIKVEPPSDWEAMYEAVRRMRAPGGAAYGAAVDTMGCERLADRNASPKDQRFHTLIALMLSSQTKDTTNAGAMARLRNELPPHAAGAPGGLNLDNILAVDPKLLNELIWAVGFHNNKTKYIKQAAEILRDEWNGDIPDTIEGLTSLPGVGPKMAYLCLSVAWNRTEGIGVDVHVHRITNMWGWHKTKNPEETRLSLQSWLPKDRWREINGLLVGLGQAVCLPVGNKCGNCELGHKSLCRAADRKKVAEGLKQVKLKEEKDIKDEDIKTGIPDFAIKEEETKPVKEKSIKREVTKTVREKTIKKEEITPLREMIVKREEAESAEPNLGQISSIKTEADIKKEHSVELKHIKQES